ncbi:hypothetical protein ACDA55_07740 [Rhizobium ruizarguesonis]
MEGADLHRVSDVATALELQLSMGEGLYSNLKSIEQRDRVRQNNPVVAARVEHILKRKDCEILMEAIIEGDGVRRIFRKTSR